MAYYMNKERPGEARRYFLHFQLQVLRHRPE